MSDDEILASARNCGFATFGGAFTALDTELLALAREIERRTLERAAKLCEGMAKQFDNGAGYSAQRCAYALNALVTK